MIGGKKLRQVIRRISWRNPPNKVYYEPAPSSPISSGFLDEMELFTVTEPEVSRSSSPSSSGLFPGQITDTVLDASTSSTPSPIPPNLTMPHLPYEILDHIIRDTPEDWISYSLVSRQWRTVACAHMFRGRTLSGTIMIENPDWLAFWTTTPSIAINVQYLLLSDCTIDLGDLEALLSSFTSLQSLEMQYFYISKTTNRHPRHTHRIQKLHLIPRNDDPWFDDVTDILSLFSEIDSFYSFESYRSAPTVDVLRKVQDVIAHGCRGKLHIRSLSPSRNQQYHMSAGMLVPFLIGIHALRSLTSLAILGSVSDMSGLGTVLSKTGKTLKSLSINISYRSEVSTTFVDHDAERRLCVERVRAGLAACTSLEEVNLQTTVVILWVIPPALRSEAYHRLWRIAVEIMALIPSHRLRKVVFRIACDGGVHIDDPERLPWDAMKDVCCALSNLESIELDMGGEEGRTCAEHELREFKNVRCLQ